MSTEQKNGSRKTFLEKYSELVVKKWKLFLTIGIIITLIAFAGIYFLKLNLTYYSLLPDNSQKVSDLKKISKNFPSASNIFVVIESKNKEYLIKAIKEISEELKKSYLIEYVKNVYSKIDTNFIKNNLLLFLNQGDSKNFNFNFDSSTTTLSTLSLLNSNIETNLLNKNSFTRLEKNKINYSLDNFNKFLSFLVKNGFLNSDQTSSQLLSLLKSNSPSESIYNNISNILDTVFLPDKYLINKDEDMALLMVQPKFTIEDYLHFTPGVLAIEKAVKKVGKNIGVKVGLTGLIVVAKDEMVTSEKGLELSTFIALLLILILLIINFRSISLPLLSSIPLVIGIIWTIGFTGIIIGKLNIITAMYMIALLGLGIDFAIHLLTAFVFERENHNFTKSIILSFKKSGRGIITGALTTAVAFFSLYIAKSNLIKELGLVAGIGILSELLAMFMFIPILLKIRNNKIERKGKVDPITIKKSKYELIFTKHLGNSIKKRYYLYIIISLIVVLVTGINLNRVKIQTNLMEMEAKGLESIELQTKLEKKFEMTPDGMFIISNNIKETQNLTKKLSRIDSIGYVDSISLFLPSKEDQTKSIEKANLLRNQIEKYNKLINSSPDLNTLLYFYSTFSGKGKNTLRKDEINNFKSNIIKLANIANYGELNSLKANLNKIFDNDQNYKLFSLFLEKGIMNYFYPLTKIKAITIDDLPQSIKETYFSNDKKYNLISLFPKKNLWIEKNRNEFVNEIEKITDKATGMILVADVLSNIAKKDGIIASIAAIIAIFIIILLDFKNIQLTIFTLFPLLFAIASLLGIMAIFKIKFDFVNIIAIPLLIGMGVDDAIHFAHRYKIEGKGYMDLVVERIGKAVTLTTLTTIFGFLSFVPSPMRAMKSTGIVLSLAMALAWFYSIFFFPAFLIFVNEKLHINIDSYFNKLNKKNQNK